MVFIKNVSDAYALVEMYEYGSVEQRLYLEAANWALKYFEQKYGKDDFRHGLLFAHMQGDNWENTFEVRVLLHAEMIGCPHESPEKCLEHMTELEKRFQMSDKRCTHCKLLEGRKEEWERKLDV